MNLNKLLLIHAVPTFAAGIVLIVAPGFIPGVVGIHLEPGAYLICYLLAAAELSLATLSFFGRTLTDTQALRVIALSCVVLHVSSGLLDIYAFAHGLSLAIWLNVAVRSVVVALFLYYGFYKTPTGWQGTQ